jgi:hypothetical protein
MSSPLTIASVARPRLSSSTHHRWQKPEDRDFAALIAHQLYGEVLHIAAVEPFVNAEKLSSPEEGLRDRFRNLLLIQRTTQTNVRALLSILERFGWIGAEGKDRQRFTLTPRGREVAVLNQSDPKGFRRLVASQLHQRYVVPGWFVSRLHHLNPDGQGEIVLPAPPRTFPGGRKRWKDGDWINELDKVVLEATRTVNGQLPGSFPIEAGRWVETVRSTWERLGQGAPPQNRFAKTRIESGEKTTFAIRGRLFHAMREAAVDLLFGAVPPDGDEADFEGGQNPIHSRSFTVWCPRLSELEFIFYTDYHPRIAGRILVPCGAFRSAANSAEFEELPDIRDRLGRSLFLFQPTWPAIRGKFWNVLIETYRHESKRIGAFYVSLLAVRDEVCRQLRLSAQCFDRCIETAYLEAIQEATVNGKHLSISLESDIRPEQRSAVGLNQRPVYIHKVPHSMIAIGVSKP